MMIEGLIASLIILVIIVLFVVLCCVVAAGEADKDYTSEEDYNESETDD